MTKQEELIKLAKEIMQDPQSTLTLKFICQNLLSLSELAEFIERQYAQPK